MKEINTTLPLSLDEIESLERAMDWLISPNATTMIFQFKSILEYNKKLLQENLLNDSLQCFLSESKDISDAEKNKQEKLSKYLKKFKETLKISGENKSSLNKKLKEYKTSSIENIKINSKLILEKEKKITLEDLYKLFYRDYCSTILDEAQHIQFIKIYDYYKDIKDKNKIIQLVKKNVKTKETIALKIEESILKTNNIKILTGLNTIDSYNLYYKLYNTNNIQIKYIPESASENIYIPSLFYMLIRYRPKNSKNYKELILYLEPSTNWGVVSNVYSTGFSSKFFNLLNTRFDEQFLGNDIKFEPKEERQNNQKFREDVTIIFNRLNDWINSNKKEAIDNNILKSIHKLKTNYPKINNAYKLLKSLFYYTSYINIIQTLQEKEQDLENTNYIIKQIIQNKYSTINEKSLLSTNIINNEYDNIDISILRESVIKAIYDKKALCDIFPDMLWTKKSDIVNNFIEIKLNMKYLKYFMKSLDLSTNLTITEMRKKFDNIILKKINNIIKLRNK